MLKRAAILIRSLLLILLLGGQPAPAHAQNSGPSESQLKAVFLYKFGNFVEWPSGAFNATNAPLVIGVSGSEAVFDSLKQVVQGRQINGHPITVRNIATPSESKDCHILFLGAAQKEKQDEMLKTVQGTGVLTVGETGGFIAAGGMINFFVEDNKVRFEINDAPANRAGLKISSKLLALAKPAPKEPKK